MGSTLARRALSSPTTFWTVSWCSQNPGRSIWPLSSPRRATLAGKSKGVPDRVDPGRQPLQRPGWIFESYHCTFSYTSTAEARRALRTQRILIVFWRAGETAFDTMRKPSPSQSFARRAQRSLRLRGSIHPPAAFFSASALSFRSQVKFGSSRPKCPFRAVSL